MSLTVSLLGMNLALSGMSLEVGSCLIGVSLLESSYPIRDKLESFWSQILELSFSSGGFPSRNTEIEVSE